MEGLGVEELGEIGVNVAITLERDSPEVVLDVGDYYLLRVDLEVGGDVIENVVW